MSTSNNLKLQNVELVLVNRGEDDSEFELYSNDTYDIVTITFDELQQLYTWAASVHESN